MQAHFRRGMVAGGMLLLGAPALGLLGTLAGMSDSFALLAHGLPAGTRERAATISLSLWSTLAGLALGALGLVVLLVCLALWLHQRSKRSNST